VVQKGWGKLKWVESATQRSVLVSKRGKNNGASGGATHGKERAEDQNPGGGQRKRAAMTRETIALKRGNIAYEKAQGC